MKLTEVEELFVSDLKRQGFRVFWTYDYLYWKKTMLMRVKRSYFAKYESKKNLELGLHNPLKNLFPLI